MNRKALWEIIAKSFDIPTKIIRIIETLHETTTGLIQTESLRSEEFPISVGVKQGDVLAPMLFNMYLDAVIRVALKRFPTEGIHLNYSYNAPLTYNNRHKLDKATIVQNLAYADDMVLTSSNIVSLQNLLDSMDNTLAKFGLKINPTKTKCMIITPNKNLNTNETNCKNNNNNNDDDNN